MKVILKAAFVVDGSLIGMKATQPKNRAKLTGPIAYESNLKRYKPNPNSPRSPVAMPDELRPFLPSSAEVVTVVKGREGYNEPDSYETVHIGPRFSEDQSAEDFLDEWDALQATRKAPKEQISEIAKLRYERKQAVIRAAIQKEAERRVAGGNLSRAEEVWAEGETINVSAPPAKRPVGRPAKAKSA